MIASSPFDRATRSFASSTAPSPQRLRDFNRVGRSGLPSASSNRAAVLRALLRAAVLGAKTRAGSSDGRMFMAIRCILLSLSAMNASGPGLRVCS